MNQNIKSKLGGLVIFDYEDLNCIEFSVARLSDGQLNLIMDIGYIDMDNPDYPYEYGNSVRTTIYEDNLVDMAKQVTKFFEMGMFDHLVFIEDTVCYDVNGSIQFEFNWNDYFLETPVDFSDTATPSLN